MPKNTIENPPSKAALLTARRIKALDLRLAGASYRQIASGLSIQISQAFRDVGAMLKEYASETADSVRNAEIRRRDAVRWARGRGGLEARSEPTRWGLGGGRRRAAVLGLDGPRKIDITTWIRERARAEGLDPDQAATDADAFVRSLPA